MSELEKDVKDLDLDLEEAKETGTDAVAAVHPPHRGPAWTVQVEQTPHRGHRRRNNLATVRQDHEMGWVEGDGFRRGF